MKNIFLTFDYELFFNKKNSIDKDIVEPTNRLLEIFNKNNVHATFFIDILYYLRLKSEPEKFKKQSELLKNQIKRLVENNHRVELHLHPHWIKSEENDNNWNFQNIEKNYRLQNFEQSAIIKFFINGTNALNEIAQEVDSNYKVIAFRAGGWCIQPFNKLTEGLKKSGIKIDTSVAFGRKRDSKTHHFNFMKSPNKEFYCFSYDVNKIIPDGEFLEIPITTYKTSYLKFLVGKFNRKIIRFANHTNLNKSTVNKDQFENNKKDSILSKFTPQYTMFSFDSLGDNINHNFLIKKINKINIHNINFISHPKLLSEKSFKEINLFTSYNYNFITLEEFYRNII